MASKPKPKIKAFWTVQGIAEQLDVSERSVHRWIDSGDLVVCRFGRSVRISADELAAFIARSRAI